LHQVDPHGIVDVILSAGCADLVLFRQVVGIQGLVVDQVGIGQVDQLLLCIDVEVEGLAVGFGSSIGLPNPWSAASLPAGDLGGVSPQGCILKAGEKLNGKQPRVANATPDP